MSVNIKKINIILTKLKTKTEKKNNLVKYKKVFHTLQVAEQ